MRLHVSTLGRTTNSLSKWSHPDPLQSPLLNIGVTLFFTLVRSKWKRRERHWTPFNRPEMFEGKGINISKKDLDTTNTNTCFWTGDREWLQIVVPQPPQTVPIHVLYPCGPDNRVSWWSLSGGTFVDTWSPYHFYRHIHPTHNTVILSVFLSLSFCLVGTLRPLIKVDTEDERLWCD